MSSQEEEPELKDLVTKCLENNGVLGKIRAQLRASTYLALEQADDPSIKLPVNNHELQRFLSSNEGVIALSLVREMLSLLSLDFTLSVFDPESSAGTSYVPMSRVALASELLLDGVRPDEPVLTCLIRSCLGKTGTTDEKVNEETFIEKHFHDESKDLTDGEIQTKEGEDYDEDFQSSASDTPKENGDDAEKPAEAGKPPSYSVEDIEEELDIPSEVLNSQSSKDENETVDVTASRSSLNADHSETL